MNVTVSDYPQHYTATIVIEIDHIPVGRCWIDYPPDTKPLLYGFPYDYAYFHSFVVNDDQRGKGYGKALFNAMLKFARSKNWHGVYWVVEEPYIDLELPHHNLYNKHAVKIEGTLRWYKEL